MELKLEDSIFSRIHHLDICHKLNLSLRHLHSLRNIMILPIANARRKVVKTKQFHKRKP